MLAEPISLDQFEHKDKVLTLINKSDDSYVQGKESQQSKLIYCISNLMNEPYLDIIYAKTIKTDPNREKFSIIYDSIIYDKTITQSYIAFCYYGDDSYIILNKTIYPVKNYYDVAVLNNDLQTMITLDNI